MLIITALVIAVVIAAFIIFPEIIIPVCFAVVGLLAVVAIWKVAEYCLSKTKTNPEQEPPPAVKKMNDEEIESSIKTILSELLDRIPDSTLAETDNPRAPATTSPTRNREVGANCKDQEESSQLRIF